MQGNGRYGICDILWKFTLFKQLNISVTVNVLQYDHQNQHPDFEKCIFKRMNEDFIQMTKKGLDCHEHFESMIG